ncbi:MAG: class I SAM-dependent methyltransferase [Candidatus Electryonea clarkiae]|nr:class I SAM-dependent methyltransferase [Candidatus Electryonea clarkiae]MDP8286651.1 class I SAM-dependent methyltransferase [Candidatus Electryonea clarkiae]
MKIIQLLSHFFSFSQSISSFNLEKQRSFIKEIASHYCKDRWAVRENISKELEPVISEYSKGIILDLGTGGGVILSILQEKGIPAVGVDVVGEMLKEAQLKGIRSLVQSDGVKLPFEDGIFSVVLLWGNTLGPIPGEDNRAALLQELRRVTSPDGFLAISVLNRFSSPLRALMPHEYTFLYKSRSNDWISKARGYNRYYSFGELKRQLKVAGFNNFYRLTKSSDSSLALLAYPN